jgi:hypothetical protein
MSSARDEFFGGKTARHAGGCVLDLTRAVADARIFDRRDLDREQVGFADEAGDEGVGRAVIDIVRPADLQDLAASHHADAVGQHHRFLEIVRDMKEGDAEAAMEPLELGLQHFLQLHVEGRQRLVQQKQLRF